jgi:hypothetical protein
MWAAGAAPERVSIVFAVTAETVDCWPPGMAADAHWGLVMDDRARIALGMGIGAALGGFVGFLLFTDRGRAFRQELEPQLEQIFGEAQRLSTAFDKTRRAVKDGLATLTPSDAGGREAGSDWSH